MHDNVYIMCEVAVVSGKTLTLKRSTLKVAPRKFVVLETNILVLIKNMKFPRGNYQTDSFETTVFIVATEFSSACHFKN